MVKGKPRFDKQMKGLIQLLDTEAPIAMQLLKLVHTGG